jgi:pimeloyl-ACP methyl ester carboxylesterase
MVPNDYGIPGLSAFLKAGYVVVATDYQGLGAGQNHEYIVGLSQARNALDIVRAARTMTEIGASDRVAVLGWSQGGLAALIAGENASYAPDLDIVGVAALAPANPATFLIPEISKQSTGGPRTGRNILLVRAYTWAYPDLQLSDLLTDIGIEAAKAASRQGIQQLAISGDAAGGLPVLFKANTNPDGWAVRFTENAPGKKVSQVPVLVMQGTADNIVPQASTDLYVSEACKSSSRVSYIKYPQIDHRRLLKAAESDFTTWIASRFANEPAPSDCQ